MFGNPVVTLDVAISEVNLSSRGGAGPGQPTWQANCWQPRSYPPLASLGLPPSRQASLPPTMTSSGCSSTTSINNLIGFKGIRSVSCKLDSKTKKARCHEEGDPTSLWCDTRASCLQLGSPCLLAKVKENWETARLPLKDNDDHLLRVLEKVKSGYDKVGRRRGLTEADIEVLKQTTVNLAPQDWEKRILNDSLTSAVQHRMKIAVMRDYLCPEGAR